MFSRISVAASLTAVAGTIAAISIALIIFSAVSGPLIAASLTAIVGTIAVTSIALIIFSAIAAASVTFGLGGCSNRLFLVNQGAEEDTGKR